MRSEDAGHEAASWRGQVPELDPPCSDCARGRKMDVALGWFRRGKDREAAVPYWDHRRVADALITGGKYDLA